MHPLCLIDAIGPFFRGLSKRTINWSKIPFEHLREADEATWSRIHGDLNHFTQQVSAMGFNAASLDDVWHLVDHEAYEPVVRGRISRYVDEFRRCFATLWDQGMQVFVTMDFFSATRAMRAWLQQRRISPVEFTTRILHQFLTDFPEVEGVIVRIGESDGRDVNDDFRSELLLKTARQTNAFLRHLLPVFERHGKKLIFRTWTVGAYPIGDLMWNRRTFAQVLSGISSDALIVSMKYGESDFFRYLPLNRNFFRTKVAKIIELQARREYEGCGEYPSFVGWEYERYIQELRQAENVVGCMVWCQTGGWVPFRRLAFIDGTALWTELNTFVTLRLFMGGALVEDAVREFAQRIECQDANALLELLRLSDEVIRELLYVEEFARQKLFFRRLRIPPMLQVYWHNIFISHSVRRILRFFVQDHDGCMRASHRAMDRLAQMKALAIKAGLLVADIEFMQDTFALLVLAREYVFTDDSESMQQRIREAKRAYKQKYPKSGPRYRYRVKLDFTLLMLQPRYLRWGINLLFRRQRGYRLVDRLITLHLLSLIYRLIAKRRPQWVPSFAKDSAMGVDVVFR
ncbi:MAG: hypothetical protein JNM99_19520 [Verrucomicrobiaceae bacterium]|nr:hypothetical protein [Verrucomicrobiaceae bacterium]